jgi:hypothetical protein
VQLCAVVGTRYDGSCRGADPTDRGRPYDWKELRWALLSMLGTGAASRKALLCGGAHSAFAASPTAGRSRGPRRTRQVPVWALGARGFGPSTSQLRAPIGGGGSVCVPRLQAAHGRVRGRRVCRLRAVLRRAPWYSLRDQVVRTMAEGGDLRRDAGPVCYTPQLVMTALG